MPIGLDATRAMHLCGVSQLASDARAERSARFYMRRVRRSGAPVMASALAPWRRLASSRPPLRCRRRLHSFEPLP
jgi:hypothetical protein